MARIFNIETDKPELRKILLRMFQSGNLNFIIGSGASMPVIPVAGSIEKDIEKLFEEEQFEQAHTKIYEFLCSLRTPNNFLVNQTLPDKEENEPDDTFNIRIENLKNSTQEVSQNYKEFIINLEKILLERKTNLLPKQVNLFSTNYDLFLEKVSEGFAGIKLNDGFSRTPSLTQNHRFTPSIFFDSLYNNGNLYSYRVEIPCINLIKIHGSLSWLKKEDGIEFSCESKPLLEPDHTEEELIEHNKQYSIILPHKSKFRETLMDRIYYDLLRLYANQLDRENSLLISFGFSFVDDHIRDITLRSLKNPTLKLVIFSYNQSATDQYLSFFDEYSNVYIITVPEDRVLDFPQFNQILGELLKNQETENHE